MANDPDGATNARRWPGLHVCYLWIAAVVCLGLHNNSVQLKVQERWKISHVRW
jgi:hypothetical protein